MVISLAEGRHRLNTDTVAGLENVSVARLAVIGDFRGFVHAFADAVADVIFYDTEVVFAKDGFNGVTNGAEGDARGDFGDAGPEGLLGDFDEVANGGGTFTDDSGESSVGVITFVADDKVKRDFVAIFQGVIRVRGAMNKLVINRDADGSGKFFFQLVIGDGGAAFDDFLADPSIKSTFGLAFVDIFSEVAENFT